MAVGQATHTAQRRLVYGANVVLQSVLLLVAVVGVVWLAQHYKGQLDVTRTGVNSLAPRTEQLLAGLNQDVKITALYTVLSEYDEAAQKRQDAVRDLLSLYEAAGHGHVTCNMIDPMKSPGPLKALLQRLGEKPAYRDQAQEHAKILEEFPALNQKITDLVNRQLDALEGLLQVDPSLRDTVLTEVSGELQRLLRRASDTAREVQGLQEEDIPRYGQAAERVRSYLDTVSGYFQSVGNWVRDKAPTAQGLTPEALTFLQGAAGEYETLLADVNALAERTRGLEAVEVEQIASQLNRWANAPPILVETSEAAEIVPFNEVWPFPAAAMPMPREQDREFKGEQAISSAILRLTQKEKTAVVFTRFGGESPIIPDFTRMQMMNLRQMPRAPFGVLNVLLRKDNFVTEDWDVKTQKNPPEVKDAARVIYVVLPPEPPQQPDPRRPPPEAGMSAEDVKIVTDAITAGGMAIFMAGWTPPQSPIPGAGGGRYEYADWLRTTWGVDVKHDYLVLPFAPSRENPNLYVPTRQTQQALVDDASLQFTDQAITEPLQALPGGFAAACPLETVAGEDRPQDVDIEPMVLVKDTNDVWAISDLMQLNEDFQSQRGTAPHPNDLRPPFPLALAATKADKGQRLVVFGSATFVANQILEMGGFVLGGGGLQAYAAYPANADLFINALHWLTQEADRISVGAQQTEVPHLDRLKDDAWLVFWKVFLVGIWPGLALLIGGGVWLFRRR